MIDSFRTEFRRYRQTLEKALAQVPDDALNQVPAAEANSVAMLFRHLRAWESLSALLRAPPHPASRRCGSST